MADRQNGLDQAGDACGGVQVAEVAFHRTQRAATDVRTVREGITQCLNLDGVAQWCAGAMRFEHADAGAIDVGQQQRILDDFTLTDHRGCGVADLVMTIVIDRAAAQHGQYRVAIAQSVLQAAQGHGTDAVTGKGALGTGVKRAAATVG